MSMNILRNMRAKWILIIGITFMQILLNMLIEWRPAIGEDKPAFRLVERVLNFDLDTGEIILINIFDEKAFPILRSYRDIEQSYKDSYVAILEKDPFANLMVREEELTDVQRKHRDAAWEAMAPLLEKEDADYLLFASTRGPLIAAHIRNSARSNADGSISKLSTRTVYKLQRRWWQLGRKKNAFLPEFRKCGAPGKPRRALTTNIDEDHPKVGRRSALAISSGKAQTGCGIRMTEETYRKFELGANRFYKNREERTLRRAFELTVEKYFAVTYEIVDGEPKPVLPESDKLPTFGQFEYWYNNVRDSESEQRSRIGDTEFELKSRQMLGDPRRMGFAPGSLCQIDSTILNLYLVSALDRTRIVGRAVTYNAIDVFSSAVHGFALLMEGPSWVGAMLALDNVVRDKVQFCAEYGIEITEDEWPCKGMPNAILADRGEFEGYNANSLVNAFGTIVHNTGVRRADWKAYVERSFGIADQRVVRYTPGYVPPRGRSRGDPDYALHAVLTPDEFRKLYLCYILDYNINNRLKKYRKNQFMVADHVPRYPLDIWNWGIRSRGGLLTNPAQDIVRLNLLPRRQASITARGIHFAGDLYYECDLALREGWFVNARTRGQSRIEIAYDPRTTERTYLPLDGGTKLEVCHRTLASTNLPALDYYDAMDYFALEEAAFQAGESRHLRSSASLQSIKEAIVGEATEKTNAALAAVGRMSKRSRRAGIRQNRAAEKEHEREQSKWSLGELPAQNASNAKNDSTELPKYIPASSNLDRIDELIEKGWSDK